MIEEDQLLTIMPYQAQWDITRACNHRCTFCLSSSGRPSENELSTNEAFMLIDQLYNEGVWFLKLMGGEPFCRKDAPLLFNYAAKKGMILSFSTNASMVTDEIADGLSSIRNSIMYAQMSLYGENRRTYRQVTGSEFNFDRSIAGLHRMVNAGIDVSVLTVITPDNVTKLQQYYEIAREAGAKEFRLTHEVALGRSAHKQNTSGTIRDGMWYLFFKSLTAIKNIQTPEDTPVLLDARPLFAEFLSQLTKCGTFYENCNAALSMLYIDPAGKVLPCPFLQHLPEYLNRLYSHIKFQDIRMQSFKEIWASATFEEFRSYFDPEKNLFKINTGCRYFRHKKCVPCAVTPCNCRDLIRLVKDDLAKVQTASESNATM